jgi:hypothetical protein
MSHGNARGHARSADGEFSAGTSAIRANIRSAVHANLTSADSGNDW